VTELTMSFLYTRGAVVGEIHVIPARHRDRLRAVDEGVIGERTNRLW
jgi:hypothetical protein